MLNNLRSNVVVDLGSTKQAAIFFDHLVPLDGVEGVSGVGCILAGSKTPVDVQKAQTIISQLLPPDFGTDQQITDFASVAAIGVSAIQAAIGFYNCAEMAQTAKEYGAKLEAPAGLMRYIGKVPVTVNSSIVDAEARDASQAEHAILSIADIQIPDTKQLSWDAIMELRKDIEARKRLRRLRVFAEKEYAGKPRAFIEDDLAVRIDDYEQTLKSWGIETILGALTTCLTLETTLPTGIASLVAVLSGLPGLEAFAASLAIPCGRFAVELGKIRLARHNAIREYPLAYMTDVKKLAG